MCGIEKPKTIEYFYFRKSKNRFNAECKKCNNKRNKEYVIKNKEKLLEYAKEYRNKHRDKIVKYLRDYYSENTELLKDQSRKKYWENPKENNRKSRLYYARNKEKVRITKNKYYRNKYKTDPAFRISKNMSRKINEVLHGQKNGYKWETLVGYTQKDLRQHLESQFKPGMTWDNYGKWNIDHRIPISIFNINGAKSKGFKKCWALDNLQPLWASDNFSKGNRLFY